MTLSTFRARVLHTLFTLAIGACVPPAVPEPPLRVNPSPTQESGPPTAEARYRVQRKTDEFTKARTVFLQVLDPTTDRTDAHCSNTESKPYILAVVEFATSPRGDTLLSFQTAYLGDAWLFIAEKDGLIFLADDSTHYPKAIRAPTREVGRSLVTESGRHAVTRDDLVWLGKAKRVRMRLWGDKGRCDLTLPQLTLDLLRMFAERELGAAP